MASMLTTFSSFIVASIVAISFQVIFFSPISPNSLEFPPPPKSLVPSTNLLQKVSKLGEGILKQPEDVAVDKTGILYTATRDGWIKRRHRNGSWENWKYIHGSHGTLLGITITAVGHLIVCDAEMGLLKVSEDGATVLASHVNGAKIRLADAVIEASDGSLYFSAASTKFGLHEWFLDVLEAKPHGQLLKYDPHLNRTFVLLDNLAFANGVALSSDQDFLVICETWKHRCLKYWLKGETKGKTEIFVELPRAPDNINLAPDGSFWIAQLELIDNSMKWVHKSKAAKHLLATFPKLTQWVKATSKKAMVVNVGSDGKIIKAFEDPTGQAISFVTSAMEFEDHLYLGNLNCDFIGKLSLTDLGGVNSLVS